MKRGVHSTKSDKAFRDKILNQEYGPVRTGEDLPPSFDWSPLPGPKPKISASHVIWTSLLILAAVIAVTVVYRYQASQQIESPIDETEKVTTSHITSSASAQESQRTATTKRTDKTADRTKGDNAHTDVLGMTGPSSNDAGQDRLNKATGVPLTEKTGSVPLPENATDLTGIQDDASIRARKEVAAPPDSGLPVSVENTDNADVNTADVNAADVNTANINRDDPTSRQGHISGSDAGGAVNSTTAYSDGSADGEASGRVDDLDASVDVKDQTAKPNVVTDRSHKASDMERRHIEVESLPLISVAGMTSPIESSDKQPVPELIVPAARLTAGNRFEIRVFSSLNQGYRILSGNGRNEEMVDRINERESASVNFGYGLQLGWNINRRWTILTGISKRSTTINYQFSKKVIYDKAREIVNSSGNFENSAEFEFETSGGRSTAITRYAWHRLREELRQGDQLDFTFNFEREYSSVVIPLQVQYNIVNNAFKLGVIAGAQYARIYKTTVRSDRPRARIRQDQKPMPRDGRDFFTKNTFDVLLRDKPFNKNIVEASIGLHLSYQISKLLDIYIQPSYSHGLNKMFASDNFSAVPTNKQIDAGIILKF
jgi:hypothetical protein